MINSLSSKNIKNEQYEIKTFNSFLSEYWDNYRYDTIKNVLLSIKEKEAEGGDPLAFLWNEYYIKELSAADIYDKYAHYWKYRNSTKDTFEKFFHKRLNWDLRKPSETTDRTKKKIVKKTHKNVENQRKKSTNEILKAIKILERISKNKRKYPINKNILSELKNNNERIKHILDKRWYILEENFNKTINKLIIKYWIKKTSIIVQGILNNEWFEKIKSNKWIISEIKNKKK